MNLTAKDFARRLIILVATRCLTGLVFLGISFIFYTRGKYELFSFPLLPLYIYALVLLCFTIAGGILLSNLKKDLIYTKKLSIHGIIQLSFDILSVSLFVYLSGGVRSPFPVFYIPVIIIGAFLFGLRGALITAGFCYIAYGLILICQYYGIFQVYASHLVTLSLNYPLENFSFLSNLITNMISFSITAILSGFVIEKWHIAEEHVRSTIYQLRFLRSLHENILDNIPSGVMVINSDKLVIYANKMATHILGLPKDKILKQPLVNYFYFEFDLEKITSITRKEIEYKNPSTGETKIIGYTIHILSIAPNNHVWIFLFQDLTDLKRLQKEAEEAERMSFIGRIASNIAHNIKNPLGAIYGAGQLIEKETVANPVFKKIASIILRETQRIDNMIQDFLKLSLAGFIPAFQTTIDPLSEINKVCHKFLREHNNKSLYNINIMDDPYIPAININPQDFEIVIWNLLLNAKDAMPEGGNIDITFNVTSVPLNGSGSEYLRLSLRDYGHGIALEIQEKIFQPFFTTKPRGTGLGLSIVSQIVKKYGGFIHFTSTQGEGTEFSLYFPIANSQAIKNLSPCPDRL